MRQDSNVSLEWVALTAKGGSHQRVELRADVDSTGEARSALALMSQGELNVLALSLFLPRVLLDGRPSASWCSTIPCRPWTRTRSTASLASWRRSPRAGRSSCSLTIPVYWKRSIGSPSKPRFCRCTAERGPGSRYGRRRHLCSGTCWRPTECWNQTTSRRSATSGSGASSPPFCRLALEAALQKIARRRLLAKGAAHADVEDMLGRARATVGLASIALFGDHRHGKKVIPELNERFGSLADAYRVAVEGAHSGHEDNLKALVKDTRKLADKLKELA